MQQMCRMGEWCVGRSRTTPPVPAPDDGRGLCWPDEQHGLHAITQLPHHWVQVAAAATATLTRTTRPTPGGTRRPEPPIPIRTAFDALAREIAWTLEVWADPVRDRAQLSTPTRPPHATTATVTADATVLATHYSVLLALPEVDYLDYHSGEPASGDGTTGVVTMIGLHQRARAMLGLTIRREPRPLPCPLPPDGVPEWERNRWGCGRHSLGWTVGGDHIDCSYCGWRCTLDQYTLYALTFIPPAAARRGVRQ